MPLLVRYAILGVFFAIAQAQSPDVFTGTWKLNAQKSSYIAKEDQYEDGVRTYTPTKDGHRVTYKMTHVDGKETKGEYTVRCSGSRCTSKVASWTRKADGSVEGETLVEGKILQKFIRAVSGDGKTLTTRFFDPKTGAQTSVQVWEKQP